jgi:hypothetical protein
MRTSTEFYQATLAAQATRLATLQRQRTLLGWARLGIFLLTALAAMQLFPQHYPAGIVALVAGSILFTRLVFRDADNSRRIRYAQHLSAINQEELEAGAGRFKHREGGAHFLPKTHPYAADLDLFGQHSLFQYINRCTSDQGKALLAKRMLQGELSAEQLTAIAQAVQELAPQVQWRQDFQESGLENPLKLQTEERILAWLQHPMPFRHRAWRYLAVLYPIFSLGVLAAFLLDWLTGAQFSFAFTAFLVFSLRLSSRVSDVHNRLSRITGELQSLEQQLALFGKLPVQAQQLQQLQAGLQANGSTLTGIRRLEKILHRFDYRLNIVVFLFLNAFLLWDLQQVLRLQQWAQQYRNAVPLWINTIAEMEVLHTLATLQYNHPDWVFPAWHATYFRLRTTGCGHPLLRPDIRVNNDFTTDGPGMVSIVTGSNMGGKSTFLRSLGVNMVLAQAGAPVCARHFELSPAALYSSMRVADNLSESTSTFYAELKKLETIITQVKAGSPVFILLDEILRGTNSLDRHTGSDALIRQLIKAGSVAVLATHDVELAALENHYPQHIRNYHFDVQVAGEELYFDYALKPGVCQSLNASILMKKIGIDL